MFSTCAISVGVFSRRVPVGALRLMTNWPGIGPRERRRLRAADTAARLTDEDASNASEHQSPDGRNDAVNQRGRTDRAYGEAAVEPRVEALAHQSALRGYRACRVLTP